MLAISDVLFTNQPLRIVPELVYPMISDENSVERFENDVNRVHNFFYDHLGSIRSAVSTTGSGSERGDYYPDGTLISDLSWPGSYKYNGKEFDNLYRLNWLDYGARQYMPDLAQFTSVDPLCEKYYHLSPYAYCANNPVNAIDPDGKLVIFVNGLIAFGAPKAGESYWGGQNSPFILGAKEYFHDTRTMFTEVNHNMLSSAKERYWNGVLYAKNNLNNITMGLKDGETIKFVTHSMGAAMAEGMAQYLTKQGYVIEEIVHINAFQAADITTIAPHSNAVKTTDYQNTDDWVINKTPLVSKPGQIMGADYIVREKSSSSAEYIHRSPISEQGVDFWKTLSKKQTRSSFIDSPIKNINYNNFKNGFF